MHMPQTGALPGYVHSAGTDGIGTRLQSVSPLAHGTGTVALAVAVAVAALTLWSDTEWENFIRYPGMKHLHVI